MTTDERERIMLSPEPYVKQIERLEARIRELEKDWTAVDALNRSLIERIAKARAALNGVIEHYAIWSDDAVTLASAILEALEGK